jgi:rfaE bifunctional protein kinase chain/domain
MTRRRLCEILERVQTVRAAVYGDLCLDIYWHADMRMSELSRETPHFAMPIVAEYISLGGGGNVAANMAALRPKAVFASGTAGRDWRGRELMRLTGDMGVDTTYVVCREGLVTNAFCKPMRRGLSDMVYEDPRLDFANLQPLGEQVEDALIKALDNIAGQADILCVSDQLPLNVYGAVTDRVRGHILGLANNGLTVVADSRDKIDKYLGKNIIIKPNEIEAARAADKQANGCVEPDLALYLSQNREVVMTLGPLGSVYAADGKATRIPACKAPGETDTVGAGDTFISGFALAVAAGASRLEAAYFAGLCSEVTIQKIGTTGTASPREVLERYDSRDWRIGPVSV